MSHNVQLFHCSSLITLYVWKGVGQLSFKSTICFHFSQLLVLFLVVNNLYILFKIYLSRLHNNLFAYCMWPVLSFLCLRYTLSNPVVPPVVLISCVIDLFYWNWLDFYQNKTECDNSCEWNRSPSSHSKWHRDGNGTLPGFPITNETLPPFLFCVIFPKCTAHHYRGKRRQFKFPDMAGNW